MIQDWWVRRGEPRFEWVEMPGEERNPDEIPGMFGVGTPMRRPRYIPLQQVYTATGGLRVHRSRECSALTRFQKDKF